MVVSVAQALVAPHVARVLRYLLRADGLRALYLWMESVRLPSAALTGRSSGRFGFSWPVAASLRNRRLSGLDFLGFPWILSSESRLINGLRGFYPEEYLSRPFLALRAPERAPVVEAMGKRKIVHGGELNPASDFLQEIVVRAVPFRPPQSKSGLDPGGD